MTQREGVLDVAARVPLQWLPGRYRDEMRAYLAEGVQPDPPLLQVLQGDLGGALLANRAARDALCIVADWLEAHLPAPCWGSRDQVQLWIVYVRRARGRALLASFQEGHDGDAEAEAAP